MNIGSNDPFSYLYDKHSALREYYDLKRKLNLTREEFENYIKRCGNYRADSGLYEIAKRK
jgi:hypothetical protein